MTARTALRIKISEPEPGKGYCVASVPFSDASVAHTPISDFSDLRTKVRHLGLDMERDVVARPTTIAWLQDQEGWPDSETVGRI